MALTTVQKNFYSNAGTNYDLQYDPTNAKVILIQSNSPNSQPIYTNGVWLNSVNISDADKSSEQQKIESTISPVVTSSGGKTPEYKTDNNILNNIPVIGDIKQSIENLGNIVQTALDPKQLENITNPDNYGVGIEEERRLFNGTNVSMTYPNDLQINLQDTLSIEMYTYFPPTGDQLLSGNTLATQSGLIPGSPIVSPNTNKESFIGAVHLPMPNGISESRDVSWSPDSLTNLNAAALQYQMKNGTITDAIGTLGLGAGYVAANVATEGKAPLPSFGQAVGALGKIGLYSQLLGSAGQEARATGSAAVISSLLAMKGIGIDPDAILARGAGVVANNNLELLFSGPQLRSFTFTYRLTARSRKEAESIKRIVRFFKQGMSPKKKRGGIGGASFFLRTPNVFKLRFKTANQNDIDGITKMKVCALQNFTTDYTPDGVWAAYDGGQPVSTRITMTFTELEPIFDTDFQNSANVSRPDLDAVSDSSLGY